MEPALKARGVAVRVDEALHRLVKHLDLVHGPLAHLVDAGAIVDLFARAEDGDEQVFVLGACVDLFLAGGIAGVDDAHFLADAQQLVPDHIGNELAVFAEASYLLYAGIVDLDGLLAQLHFVLPLLVLAYGAELVDRTEGGLVVGGDEFGTDAPDLHFGILLLERGDDVLVEVIAGDDAGLLKACLIEELPRLQAKVGEVTAVDAHACQLAATGFEDFAYFYGMLYALDGVIGIDEQHAVIGHDLGIGLEGFQLGVKRHDPAMGMGACDGDAKELAREHVAGARAAAYVGGAAGRKGAVDALGAAQAKLKDRLAAGGDIHAGCLGGDEGLEVDDVEQGGLDELALGQRSPHPDDRFVREGDRALGHGIDLDAQLKVEQVVEEVLAKEGLVVIAFEATQVSDVAFAETKGGEEVHDVFQPADEGESPIKGVLAKEEVKNAFLLRFARFVIAIGHGELVEVGEQGEGRGVNIACDVHRVCVVDTWVKVHAFGRKALGQEAYLYRL